MNLFCVGQVFGGSPAGVLCVTRGVLVDWMQTLPKEVRVQQAGKQTPATAAAV